MSARPFMQWYIGDYLRDTGHLNAEQHGAYLLLLGAMWVRDGSVPNDAAQLAQIARVERRRWPAVWAVLSPFFIQDNDGGLTQKRLRQEIAKANEIGAKRRENGKLGGQAKALKSASIGLAIASVLPAVSHQSASLSARRLPYHSHIESKISNLTTSEQDSAPAVEDRSESLKASLRRMGRLKDGKDEDAA